jgi:hypothetical protein
MKKVVNERKIKKNHNTILHWQHVLFDCSLLCHFSGSSDCNKQLRVIYSHVCLCAEKENHVFHAIYDKEGQKRNLTIVKNANNENLIYICCSCLGNNGNDNGGMNLLLFT